MRCVARTLGTLVEQAEELLGENAEVALNRPFCARYACRRCEHFDNRPGLVETRSCPKCRDQLVPAVTLTSLSRNLLGSLSGAPIDCLGVKSDLVRVLTADGSDHTWIHYAGNS